MSESPLAKKLQVRSGHHVLALHAPDGFEAAPSPLPEGAILDHRARGQHDVVLVFAASKGRSTHTSRRRRRR
jgi:LmbE family N-acetylglucosaminyl deacetylase